MLLLLFIKIIDGVVMRRCRIMVLELSVPIAVMRLTPTLTLKVNLCLRSVPWAM